MNEKISIRKCYCGNYPSLCKTNSGKFFLYCEYCGIFTETKGTKISAINRWQKEDIFLPTLKTKILKKIHTVKIRKNMMNDILLTDFDKGLTKCKK